MTGSGTDYSNEGSHWKMFLINVSWMAWPTGDAVKESNSRKVKQSNSRGVKQS